MDFRYAARSLARAPMFTLAAILTIALGIGVNTAVFHVIHAVVLDPLPYPEPNRLVHVAETHPDFPSYQVAAPDLADWQRSAKSFESLAAHTFQAMNKWTISGDGEPAPVQVVQASHTLFGMLGARPLIGRFYTAGEEAAKAPVVVLSEAFWRSRYQSDPSIIGRRIRLVTWPVTVVGVVAQRQAQPPWAEVWMPMTFLDPALTETRRFHALEVIGRLKPGVTVAQAQAEMTGIARNLARAYPETNGLVGARVVPFALWMTGEVRPALWIVWAAVSLVLLLACANVAHLVLVRAVHRSREMAIRAAMGAGIGQLMRLLMAENLLVAAGGGALGVLLARALTPWLPRLVRMDDTVLSPAAALFAAAATLICALLFAIPAMWHARRLDLQQVIKQSDGLAIGHRGSWFGPAIIAAEIALAFVVLTGAGLLYRSFAALLDEPTGFDSRGVLAAHVPMGWGNWEESAVTFRQKVAPALRAIPGVTTVGAANLAPMTLHQTEISRFTMPFGIVGRPSDPDRLPTAQLRWITPDYFATLRIPLRRGRLFAESDIGKAGYIINDTLARLYFPGRDPVGEQLIKDVTSANPRPVPIVGVVGDVRDLGLDVEPRPTVYELGVSNSMAVMLRGEGNPAVWIPAVRDVIRKVSPDSPILLMAPLERVVRDSLARRRLALELLGFFAALAALLTVVGVYGVIRYSLSRREAEFAIRFALGAEPKHLYALLFRNFIAPVAVGLLLGAWLAVLFAGLLRGQLYRLSPADPAVLAGAAAGLALLVLLSALRPAMQASALRRR